MSEVDLLAIGCGPFNLGAAALASTVPDIRFLGVDTAQTFSWHAGVMFPDAKVQTSFLADLVSIIAPTHPLSFLQYLVENDRMYPFYIREDFHLTRIEYEDYIKWAIKKIDNIKFGIHVHQVNWDGQNFQVKIEGRGETGTILAKNILCGIGTAPWVPKCLQALPSSMWMHSSEYLHRVDELDMSEDITVIGAGQSGAEIFRDLLLRFPPSKAKLHWLTRSGSFAPLDYTKLVLEMTTPCYVRHFYEQSEKIRDQLNKEQSHHYRGISASTLEEIYELIYQRSIGGDTGVGIHVAKQLEACEHRDALYLKCREAYTKDVMTHRTERVIAATGYRHRIPDFLEPVDHHLARDSSGRISIGLDHAAISALPGKIYIANGDLHTHGVAAPDLGICAWRNARIINQVVGRTVYHIPQRTAFTHFRSEAR